MSLSYPKYNTQTLKRVQQVLKSGKVNYWTGSECKKFENELAKYINTRYAVSLSNGSVSLDLALKALDLKKSQSVIVTPRSFIISASCVLNLGLKPIFADVDDNGNLNINEIKKVYNKSVGAIIIVHLNGLSCDLDPIIKFIKKKKIFLIEDCSQSHGAIYKNKKVGSFGHISTWSFCQDKIISTGGEGGMILTNNKKLWHKIWSLKDHGKDYKSVFYKKYKTGFRWLHHHSGSNYRMTEIQAAIGREQLKKLDNQIKKRNLIANLYIKELKEYYHKYDILKKPNFKCETCPFKYDLKNCNKCTHSFYRLNLFINQKKINQIKLVEKLNENKVECHTGSCPEIYREKIFKKSNFHKKKRLPNAKLLGETSIMFPINPFKSINYYKKKILIIKKCFNNLYFL